MLCPYCRTRGTRVVDKRDAQDGAIIRRRRKCLACDQRFTTYEQSAILDMAVIKKDGSRVPFDRERIRSGLEKACYKRPISETQIEQVICEVESQISEDMVREVPSRMIGEAVFNALREIDQVAFVRFASVYREFKDVRDFVDELEPMLKNHHLD